MINVKICGQTRMEDIEYSFVRGAYLCGVVIEVPSSKRTVTVEKATPLFERFGNRLVALSADADDVLLEKIAKFLKPAAIQMTANETPDDIDSLKNRFGIPIFKSLHLPPAGEGTGSTDRDPARFLEMIARYSDAGADGFILDTSTPKMYGGSGIKSDWKIADEIIRSSDEKIFLAGGINPENAPEAAALEPFAIDLASGVEISPGIKSKEKIDLLFTALGDAGKIRGGAR